MGLSATLLPQGDDLNSDPIGITSGFPFNRLVQETVYVRKTCCNVAVTMAHGPSMLWCVIIQVPEVHLHVCKLEMPQYTQ